MRSRAILLTLGLACAPLGSAGADTLQMRGGGLLEGDVREDGEHFEVRLPSGGIVRVSRDDVVAVTLGDTFRDEYIRRINRIDRTDAEALYRLGLFCKDHALLQEGLAVFRLAVEAVPDHRGARAALDEVLFEGRWMPRAEAMERQGLVRHGRAWVTPEEKSRLAWKERERVCQAEVRRLGLRVRSPEQETRLAASRALASLDDPAAFEALHEASGHWHPALRYSSIPALARRSGEEEARVSARLAEIASRDSEILIQDLAADEIRARRLTAAAEGLIEIYIDAEDSAVRKAAAHALGRIRYKPAFETLWATLYFTVLRRRLVPVMHFTPVVQATASFDGVRLRRRALRAYDLQPFDYKVVEDTAFNAGARDGLRGLTGVDYDFDKTGWWRWWAEREAGLDAWMEPLPNK